MKHIFNSLFFRTVAILIFASGYTNAQVWTKTTPAASSLWAVWGTNASNVWVSGNSGTLSKWNGTSWSSFSIAGITGQRYGLWGSSASNIYSVGGTTGQQIANFNGTSWSLITSAITTWGSGVARSICGSSANDIWIVGGAGRALRYNGTTWAFQTAGLPGTLTGIVVWGLMPVTYTSVAPPGPHQPVPFISGMQQIQRGSNKLPEFAQSAPSGQQLQQTSGQLVATARQQVEEFITPTEQPGRM